MPWILAGGGVVVVAVVVVLIIVLTGGGGTSSPQDLAESAASAMNDKDYDAVAELTCEGDKEDVKENVDIGSADPAFKNVSVEFTIGEVKEEGDTATADVSMKLSNLPAEYEGMPSSVNGVLNMKKDGGDWCITGFSPAAG
ncbi:Rv0361 family membrane protein [Actinophytocola sp. KF-1]